MWKEHLLRVGLKISGSPAHSHSTVAALNPLLLEEHGSGMPRVLVRLGGHHRTAQTQGLVNDRSLLLTVIEAGGSKVTVPAYSVSNEKPSWFGDLTRQKGATELFGLAVIEMSCSLSPRDPTYHHTGEFSRGLGRQRYWFASSCTESLLCKDSGRAVWPGSGHTGWV